MSKLLVSVLVMGLSLSTFAAEKKPCGKYKAISCSKVDGAKRSHFCWKKGNLSAERKAKICTTEKRKKRAKKLNNKKTIKS